MSSIPTDWLFDDSIPNTWPDNNFNLDINQNNTTFNITYGNASYIWYNNSGIYPGFSNTSFSDEGFLWKLRQRRGREDMFKQVLNVLNIYFTPVIIIVGLAGNILSFLVFSMTHLTRLSSSVYLAALSVADTGFLLALAIVWFSRIGVPLFTSNGWCQSTVYLTYVFSFLSMWNVVSFTAERYIIVHYPLRKDSYCTHKKAKLVVGLLFIIASVMYTFAIWTSGVVKFGPKSVCMPLPDYYDILTIMTSIDTLISCVIPSLLIVTLNVKIILKLHRYQKKRAQLSTTTMILEGPTKLRRRSILHTSISTTGSVHIRFTGANKELIQNAAVHIMLYPDNCKRVMRCKSQFRTARMLLILSSVVVLLNLPSHVFRVQVFLENFIGGTPRVPKSKIHWKELFQLIYFLNFAVNFFVYNACGRQFRDGLKRVCQNFTLCKKSNQLRRVVSQEKIEIPKMSHEGDDNASVKPNVSPI